MNLVNKLEATALSFAVGSGSVATVEVFLESARVAVNCLDARGSSALHHAAFAGHADIVELLLKHERITAASKSVVNKSGNNALHLAALQGHMAVIRMLLQAKQFPDHAVNAKTSREGASALHIAIQFSHFSAVQLLLASPRFLVADSITNGDGYTALHQAAKQDDVNIVKVTTGFVFIAGAQDHPKIFFEKNLRVSLRNNLLSSGYPNRNFRIHSEGLDLSTR